MMLLNSRRTRCFLGTRYLYLFILVGALLTGPVGFASDQQGVHHYKMVSSIEYTGKGQFRNQVETLFTVRKQPLSDNKVQYSLSLDDHDPNVAVHSSVTPLSFIIDRNTWQLSNYSQDMAFWAKVNNESVKSLTKVTKDNVGKTWKQSIDLSSLGGSLPSNLKFTLAAIKVTTDKFGEMVAVRALSEPFFIKVGKGSARCRMNAVYLFDPHIENIYLSISVFEASTDTNGFKETLHHEVATYKTDTTGTSVDLTGLGTEFEKFAREVGLRTKSVKVVKEVPLPLWAQSEGVAAAQVANICVALACEGASNPVATVCIPAARLLAMQSVGQISAAGAVASAGTVATTLGQSVPGIATMKIAMAPAFAGLDLGTASTVAAASAGGVAVAANNSNGGGKSNRSPSTP
jgi:hypothetical protein